MDKASIKWFCGYQNIYQQFIASAMLNVLVPFCRREALQTVVTEDGTMVLYYGNLFSNKIVGGMETKRRSTTKKVQGLSVDTFYWVCVEVLLINYRLPNTKWY